VWCRSDRSVCGTRAPGRQSLFEFPSPVFAQRGQGCHRGRTRSHRGAPVRRHAVRGRRIFCALPSGPDGNSYRTRQRSPAVVECFEAPPHWSSCRRLRTSTRDATTGAASWEGRPVSSGSAAALWIPTNVGLRAGWGTSGRTSVGGRPPPLRRARWSSATAVTKSIQLSQSPVELAGVRANFENRSRRFIERDRRVASTPRSTPRGSTRSCRPSWGRRPLRLPGHASQGRAPTTRHRPGSDQHVGRGGQRDGVWLEVGVLAERDVGL
jgi:hypothetical protein